MKNNKLLIVLIISITLLQLFTISVAVAAKREYVDGHDLSGSERLFAKYLVTLYVKDLTGTPIESATVQTYQSSVLVNETTTNPLGKAFVSLEPGTYDVIVKKHGYKDGYYECKVTSNMAATIYLEVGAGSLENGGNLLYVGLAIIGTVTAVFSATIGYRAYTHQRKHNPAKVLEKIIEEPKKS